MSKRFARAAGAGLAAVAVAGFGVVVAAPAFASTVIGQVTIVPGSGTDQTALQFQTSTLCTQGTNFQLGISGGAFPAGAAMNGNVAQSTAGQGNGGYLTSVETFSLLAQSYGVTFTAGTTYALDFECKNAFGPILQDMTGSVTFSDAHTFTAAPLSSNAVATATSVTGSAATGQQGAPVTFTASVTPAAAAGTVQFKDGAANLGTPVAVTGGTAALNTSAVTTVGAHNITAVFTPTDPTAYQASTSPTPFAYTVTAAPATPTTTALGVTPNGTQSQNAPVTLTATVAPTTGPVTPGPAGTVQFTDGNTNLGAPVPVAADGTATLTLSTLGIGTHSFNAAYTTSNAQFLASATTVVTPYTITSPVINPGQQGTETITTTVLPGALAISVPNGQVTLPSPTLDANGDLFQTAGQLNTVTVTDGRAGNPGWTVSGQVSDFVSTTVSSAKINGENLGWTPTVVDHGASQTVTLGNIVNPANGVAAADTGSAGLKGSQTLASGTGLGTAHLAAGLAMNIPTSTGAGTYTATLTLTAI